MREPTVGSNLAEKRSMPYGGVEEGPEKWTAACREALTPNFEVETALEPIQVGPRGAEQAVQKWG